MTTIRFSALLAAAVLLMPAAARAVEMFSTVARAKSTQPAPDHLIGTLPIAFNAGELTAMSSGQTATMVLPNGRRYEVVLDRIDRHEGGGISWVGHVAGESADNLVIVTLGPSGSYANFTLPDGNWGVVPGEGHDWLFDSDVSHLYVERSTGTDARVPRELANAIHAKVDPICPVVTALPSPQTLIDLLFVMTPDFVSAHGGAANAQTRINNLISSINTYYANSKVAITLRRVAAINVDYPAASAQGSANCSATPEPDACDTKALDNVSNGVGAFSNVGLLRDLYGADMVLVMRGPTGGGGISGVAWIGGYNQTAMSGSSRYMFSVNGDAPGFSGTLVAHEVGHNMGNHHDPSNTGTATYGATSYAYGYTRCGSSPSQTCPSAGGFNSAGSGGFGTIMSYWRPTIARFSNPNDTCSGNGSGTVACGGTIASSSPAFSVVTDEVRTINCTRQAIASMKTAHVPDCANMALDTDGDGAPDCVERALGSNVNAKDNDLFPASAGASLRFALQQYRDFLSRQGDADGVHFWSRSLAAGTYTRGQMVEGFFNSAEFQGVIAPVARLYFAYFLRIPDYAGLQFWIGQYRAGMSLNQISQSFASSAEFASQYGGLNNTQFVTLVYNNVLGRAPDAAGLAFWTGQLSTGAMDRGTIMVGFSESPEYRAVVGNEVYVTMMYMGMLRRAPDAGGFNYWVGYLDSANSGLALINGFLGASEYRARFL